jgi:hypothetical protein
MTAEDQLLLSEIRAEGESERTNIRRGHEH